MLKRVFGHVSVYAVGNLLVTAAGFVTFPILTRLFSVEDYGVLNLISATLLLLVALGKFGIQHAIVRMYSEVRLKSKNFSVEVFVSTVVYSMLVAGTAVAILWAAAIAILPDGIWTDRRMKLLLLLTAVLIPIRVLDSAFGNLLRAQELSGALTIYTVVRRYGILVITLGVLFLVAGNIWGFYVATIIGELLAVLALGAWMLRAIRCRPSLFSRSLLVIMLGFGVPMIGFELSGVVLQLGDRYVLHGLSGDGAVGIYSAAYNLCEYVQGVIIAGVSQAVMPTYLRIWEEQGAEATSEFLSKFLRIYALIALPIAAGLAAVGEEVLTLLAGEKYVAGAIIIPYVIVGMALDGIISVTGAGLYIRKRSKTIVALVASCAIVNIVLNFILIPFMGIAGAAVATLLSYLLMATLSVRLGSRCLKIPIPFGAIVKFGLISIVMYFVVRLIKSAGPMSLVIQVAIGSLVYGALVLASDSGCRDLLRRGVRKLRRIEA